MNADYTTDYDPLVSGVYAVRVDSDRFPGMLEDKILTWVDRHWSYPSSDQNFRGKVYGWIGPLPRTKKPLS